MRTQFMECNDINCLSEFDPTPFIYSNFFGNCFKELMNTKKVWGLTLTRRAGFHGLARGGMYRRRYGIMGEWKLE